MTRRLQLTATIAAALAAAALAAAEPPAHESRPAHDDEQVAFRIPRLQAVFERATGAVRRLLAGPAPETLGRWPNAAFVEVVDLRDRKVYSALTATPEVTGWRVAGDEAERSLSFTLGWEDAPFTVEQGIRAATDHLRWTATVRLRPGEKLKRSVQVNWVLPLPMGWRYWTPKDLEPRFADGVSPYRAVYGHSGFGRNTTLIPLAAAWRRRGGLVCWSPPDAVKTQIVFELGTDRLPDPPWGMARRPEDRPPLRVEHHLIGLRPGKPLTLAVCLAGIEPGWRPALGRYVEAYPELFEPVPATRKIEGMYAITGLGRMTGARLAEMRKAGVTFVELHGSFPEYGVYMTEAMLADPDRTVTCKPHPDNRVSLASNRKWIRRFKDKGIAPFMYFYNCHALPATIEKRWPGAAFRDEAGRPLLKWHTEPSVYGPPDSPFGRHMVEQMGLALRAYPELPGFFIDNFGIEMVSFAHDDGVTMIRHRPAYDLNRNHQGLGPACFELAHKAGKIIMVNKLATIESARGADMMLTEGNALHSLRQHALACVFRPIFPLHMRLGRQGEAGVERCLQHLLLLGGTPEEGFARRDAETMAAYRPLTDALIGKRWVLTRNPLTVPDGYEGQIFRIDRHAACGGDVVVALADLYRSRRERRFTKGLTVKVRVPEAARLTRATWLTVEKSGEAPIPCELELYSGQITVRLPPAGAAGILRLTAAPDGAKAD